MRQGLALEICEFHQVIFRPTKPLKLTGSRFPERSANFYSVLSRVSNGTLCPLVVLLASLLVLTGKM